MTYEKITNYFQQEIEGGTCKEFFQIMDEAIEDGLITQEFFDTNELAICDIFDSSWFTCECCNWTLPRYAESNDAEGICEDCS